MTMRWVDQKGVFSEIKVDSIGMCVYVFVNVRKGLNATPTLSGSEFLSTVECGTAAFYCVKAEGVSWR